MTPERYRQIVDIFHEAAVLSPENRAAFLAKECSGDSELLAEVEGMLSADARTGILAQPANDLAAGFAASKRAASLPTHLGPYEIVSLLGAGGMGQVYRARDARLSREVAIKVLPEEFSNTPERLRRFEAEARAVGMLNHPNVLQVHDVGTDGGRPFLVTELLQGHTLRERLAEGPMPLSKAIEYARQMATGLAAAHDKHIVHRDLKPENLFLTSDGRLKILDFGLAKFSQSPIDERLTGTGVILGTPDYMSPEQAMGKALDHRSDIFSSGVVVYEMLSGRQAFHRYTKPETMAAILREEPETLIGVPAGVQQIVKHCLEKEPGERFQSAHDLAFALGSLGELGAPTLADHLPPSTPGRRLSTRSPWILAGAIALLAAVALWAPWRSAESRDRGSRSVVRFQVPLPVKPTGPKSVFRLSPNGRMLAYTSDAGGLFQLYARSLDSLEARLLPGTDNANFIFWSPDSANLGFFADGKLKRVGLRGEPSQTLCDSGAGLGGSWNRDGTILFATGAAHGLMRVPETGGSPKPAADRAGAVVLGVFPEFLNGGTRYFYSRGTEPGRGVYVGSLDGMEPVRVLPDFTNVAYLPKAYGKQGDLIFWRNGALMSQTFDSETLHTAGAAAVLAPKIRNGAYFLSWGAFSAVPGILAFQAGSSSPFENLADLVSVDRTRKRSPVMHSVYSQSRLSPDGTRLAFLRRDPRASYIDPDIWIQDLALGTSFRLTSFGSSGMVWSPDGRRIVFSVRSPPTPGFWQVNADGGSKPELLAASHLELIPYDWSPDGKQIVCGSYLHTSAPLFMLPLETDRQPAVYLQSPFVNWDPRFSPDGRWMAYVSDESGQDEVYVRSISPSGPKYPISTGGGRGPRWRRDGKELFFLRQDGSIVSVPVTIGQTFTAGKPKPLLDGAPLEALASSPAGTDFEPFPDGRRFLLALYTRENLSPPVTVVLNWESERP